MQPLQQQQQPKAASSIRRRRSACHVHATQQPADESGSPQQTTQRPSQWQRFVGFVQAGDAKEAWLCISATVLKATLPAALLAWALHGSLWGGAPPGPVVAAEAAAYAGLVVAGGSELWKILEGFQG